MEAIEIIITVVGAISFLVFALGTVRDQRCLRKEVWRLEEKIDRLKDDGCQRADDRSDGLDRVVSG